MKKILVAAISAATLIAPGLAIAQPPTARQFGVYRYVYRHARARFGATAVGCEIRYTCHGDVTAGAVQESTARMIRWLHPPIVRVPVVEAPAPAPTTATSTPAYSGGYSIPSSIVQCESGGNWNAVNPSSGAGGAYQILPSTWAAYGGTGAPQDASPAEQSAIAARIYASQGPGAWTC